jgi:hypothetical protein
MNSERRGKRILHRPDTHESSYRESLRFNAVISSPAMKERGSSGFSLPLCECKVAQPRLGASALPVLDACARCMCLNRDWLDATSCGLCELVGAVGVIPRRQMRIRYGSSVDLVD